MNGSRDGVHPVHVDATKSGNGERGTGNDREPGTGVWERVYSGNP